MAGYTFATRDVSRKAVSKIRVKCSVSIAEVMVNDQVYYRYLHYIM